MKDDPFARVIAAEAKAAIEEMKLTLIHNFEAMMVCCRAGVPIPIDGRVRYRYDSAVVADRCPAKCSRLLVAVGYGRTVIYCRSIWISWRVRRMWRTTPHRLPVISVEFYLAKKTQTLPSKAHITRGRYYEVERTITRGPLC